MVLAQSKQLHEKYTPPRESPQWSITTAALNANCSPRVIDLALSKKCHPRFVGPKPVQTQVPFSARNVKPTHRILVLSVPLPRKITCKLEEFQKRKLYEIKHTSISSPTYPRLERLAISKNLHPSFIPSQPTQRLITKATLTANASPRVVELSTPQSRKLIKDTYDPFKVNPTTQHVTASDRILALSKPKKHYL